MTHVWRTRIFFSEYACVTDRDNKKIHLPTSFVDLFLFLNMTDFLQKTFKVCKLCTFKLYLLNSSAYKMPVDFFDKLSPLYLVNRPQFSDLGFNQVMI